MKSMNKKLRKGNKMRLLIQLILVMQPSVLNKNLKIYTHFTKMQHESCCR